MSNHGIDAIGKCAEKNCYRAFEVKTSFNGTPGKLSARQEVAVDFIKDILGKASMDNSTYNRQTSKAAKEQCGDLLQDALMRFKNDRT